MRAWIFAVIGLANVWACSPAAAPTATPPRPEAEIATATNVEAAAPASRHFNHYILQAIANIDAQRGHQGYDIGSSYTRNLNLAGVIPIAAGNNPPRTMCVAAQMEIIVEALNLYVEENPQLRAQRVQQVTTHTPAVTWTSLAPMQLRGQIWIVSELRTLARRDAADINSFGAADALVHLGMGEAMPFEAIEPGAFINLNRNINARGKYTGHGVIFINYIDVSGAPVESYDAERVAGFRYYSAQGTASDGGFGYKLGFFAIDDTTACPPQALQAHSRDVIDCGIRRQRNQQTLNTGHMLHPDQWNAAQMQAWLTRMNQLRQDPTRGPAVDEPGNFNGAYFDGDTNS
jgi:hypothetical protein